jgi:hypothetical protein
MAVFVAVNPFLYPDPVARTRTIAREWSATKRNQQDTPSLAHRAVRAPGRGLALTAVRSLVPGQTPDIPPAAGRLVPGLRRLTPFAAVLAVLAGAMAYWRGLRLRPRWKPRRYLPEAVVAAGGAAALLAGKAGFFAVLFAMGWLGLVRVSRLPERSEAPAPSACFPGERDGIVAVAVTWSTLWLTTGLWLPFDWARYYLPTMLAAALMATVGAATVASGWRIEGRRAGGT